MKQSRRLVGGGININYVPKGCLRPARCYTSPRVTGCSPSRSLSLALSLPLLLLCNRETREWERQGRIFVPLIRGSSLDLYSPSFCLESIARFRAFRLSQEGLYWRTRPSSEVGFLRLIRLLLVRLLGSKCASSCSFKRKKVCCWDVKSEL